MYLIGYLKTEFCHETALSLVMISICQWQFSYIIYYQDWCIDIKWCIHWNILQPLKCGKFHQNPSILESFCHDTYNLYLVHYTLTTCPQHANIKYVITIMGSNIFWWNIFICMHLFLRYTYRYSISVKINELWMSVITNVLKFVKVHIF